MTLTEILLARIAEDKVRADDAWKAVDNGAIVWDRIHPDVRAAIWTPDRVLAECEAKRRIVEAFGDYDPEDHWDFQTFPLRALAAVYADHPDYDETWRP